MTIFIIRRILVLSALIVLSGCAFWPTIKSADQLEPDNNPAKGCLALDLPYPKAQNCAHQTLNEIDGMIDDTGYFDRGFSYVVVGLASAAGAAIGFGSSVDTLKGLGIASGSLLGINTIVDTTTQRLILIKGRRQLDCVIREADALNTSAKIQTLQFNSGAVDPTTMIIPFSDVQSISNTFTNISLISQIEVRRLISIEGNDPNLAKLLTTQYLLIISEIREKLASSVKHIDYSEQKDRVSQAVGKIVREYRAAKDASKIAFLTSTSNTKTFSAVIDSTSEQVNPILKVFDDCASDAAKSMLNNP